MHDHGVTVQFSDMIPQQDIRININKSVISYVYSNFFLKRTTNFKNMGECETLCVHRFLVSSVVVFFANL